MESRLFHAPATWTFLLPALGVSAFAFIKPAFGYPDFFLLALV